MAKMGPKRQAGKPKPPSKPTAASGAGKVGGRYTSKTNDPRCTLAMSMLQKAIKAGQRPSAETSRMLAMCRNRSRRRIDAPKRQERLARIQALRKSGNRSEALAIARADRQGQTARNQAAALLRQLRQGRGGQYARQAQSMPTDPQNRKARGNELLARLREVTPASTLRRAGRHARGDRSYEERRQGRRSTQTTASAPKPTPKPKPTPEPKPAPAPVRKPPTRAEEAGARVRNAFVRGGGSAAGFERQDRAEVLSRLRLTRAGRAIAADVRQRIPNAQARDYRFAITSAQTAAASSLGQLRDRKIDAIRDRVARGVVAERDTMNRVRRTAAVNLEMLRGARIANDVRPDWRITQTRENVQFLRAATSRGQSAGNRRAPLAARQAYADTVVQARQRAAIVNAPPSAPASPPAAAAATTSTRRPRGTRPTALLNPTSARPIAPVPQAQIDAARQQSGTFTGHGAFTRYSRQDQADLVYKAESQLRLKLHGSTPEEKFSHLMSLSGIPPQGAGALTFSVTTSTNGTVRQGYFNWSDRSGSRLQRTITTDTNTGLTKIHNDYFTPAGALRSDGHPMDIYSRQILAAKAAGVHMIDVQGGGNGGYLQRHPNDPDAMTGFYIWPSYGFDAKLSSSAKTVFANAHPQLANVNNFSEALFHPDPDVAKVALDAWKRNGLSMINYQLDLTNPNSTSFQNFQRFYRKRRNQDFSSHNASSNISRTGDYNAYS